MYSLDYKDVKEKLESSGYLKLFSASQNQESILVLDSQALGKLDLKTGKENELLVVYNKGNLDFYEVNKNSDNLIGYGDESAINPGKNLKTGEPIAVKLTTFDSQDYRGWKVAYQKLNQHPNFVKSYALGRICDITEKSNSLAIIPTTYAYLIMEKIEGRKDISNLEEIAKHWTADRIIHFMRQILDAYETFMLEGIINFDDSTAGNILLDEHYNPKLCDFNQLEITTRELYRPGFYKLAMKSLWYIFKDARSYAWLSKTNIVIQQSDKLESILDNFMTWIDKQDEKLSRKIMEEKLHNTIHEIIQERCAVYCLVEKQSGDSVFDKKFLSKEQEEKAKQDCDNTCSSTKITIEVESDASSSLMNPTQYVSKTQAEKNSGFFGIIPGVDAALIPESGWSMYVTMKPATTLSNFANNQQMFLPSWEASNVINLVANTVTVSSSHSSNTPTGIRVSNQSNTGLTPVAIIGLGFYCLYNLFRSCKRDSKSASARNLNIGKQKKHLELIRDQKHIGQEIFKMQNILAGIYVQIMRQPDYTMAFQHCKRNLQKLDLQFKRGKVQQKMLNQVNKDILHLQKELNTLRKFQQKNSQPILNMTMVPAVETSLRRRKNTTQTSGF